jgi:hypothetical protein
VSKWIKDSDQWYEPESIADRIGTIDEYSGTIEKDIVAVDWQNSWYER